ncbi:uncharacterized protein B4U79_03409, partial [Dinothrombium tinctorium]
VWERLWIGGKVPYVLDKSLTKNHLKEFFKAIGEYHSRTCIRFVPRSSENVFVTIKYKRHVCGLAYGTTVEIGDACGGGPKSPLLIHELGHILGYAHEQNRPDRDQWISGNGDAGIGPVMSGFETFGIMYDYVSIMHYEGQCRSWKILKPGVTKCGGGNHLSVLDVDKFNAAYKCKGCHGYRWKNIKLLGRDDEVVNAGYDFDRTNFVPCRAFYYGDIIPGKGVLNAKVCYVAHGGKEHKIHSDFEVLTRNGADLRWDITPDLPAGSIAGGRTNERETYWVGRCFVSATVNGQKKWSLAIGKIYDSKRRNLIISLRGREMPCETEIEYLRCF